MRSRRHAKLVALTLGAALAAVAVTGCSSDSSTGGSGGKEQIVVITPNPIGVN